MAIISLTPGTNRSPIRDEVGLKAVIGDRLALEVIQGKGKPLTTTDAGIRLKHLYPQIEN